MPTDTTAGSPPAGAGSPKNLQDDAPKETDMDDEKAEEAETPKPKPKRGRKRGTVEKSEEVVVKEKRSQSLFREGESPVERPSRERKAVERFSAMSPARTPPTKILSFKQGSGTKLKEIPNVLFKVSKRKTDDTLQVLHTLLFGKKSNVHFLKRNILQFSGFVWSENEEKQRTRMKDKIDKFNREKLLELCELLDIHAVKSSTKKEEVTTKLLEFLESPSVTRDVLLSEKLEKRKRKRKTKGSRTSDAKSTERKSKKQRKNKETTKEENEDEDAGVAEAKEASVDIEDEHNSGDESEQHMSEQGEEKDEELEAEDEEEDKPDARNELSGDKKTKKDESSKNKQKASTDTSTTPEKSNKIPSKPAPKESEDEQSSPEEMKEGSSKVQNGKGSKASRKEKAAEHKKASAKASKEGGTSATAQHKQSHQQSTSKSKKENKKKGQEVDNPAAKKNKANKHSAKVEPKASTKKQGKNKRSGDSNSGPSTEELHTVVSEILKEVDFNTATLADILKQLGRHFNMDLMDRKSEIKRIIEDVISNMSDDEDGDNEDGAQDHTNDDSDGDSK